MSGLAVDPAAFLQDVRRPDHQLGGETCPVGTFAPHQGSFDPDHVEPGPEEPQREVLTARSDTEHDHIYVGLTASGGGRIRSSLCFTHLIVLSSIGCSSSDPGWVTPGLTGDQGIKR